MLACSFHTNFNYVITIFQLCHSFNHYLELRELLGGIWILMGGEVGKIKPPQDLLPLLVLATFAFPPIVFTTGIMSDLRDC